MSQYRKPDEGLIGQATEVWSEGPEEVPYASDMVDKGPMGPEGSPYRD